jgi:hypothetical protein
MIELISILASLAVLFLTPFEVNRIRKGYVAKKFESDPEKYRTAFRKQVTMLIWVGLVLGLLQIGLSFVEKSHGENVVKIVAGVIWLAVAGVCFVSRGMLPPSAPAASAPAPDPVSGPTA